MIEKAMFCHIAEHIELNSHYGNRAFIMYFLAEKKIKWFVVYTICLSICYPHCKCFFLVGSTNKASLKIRQIRKSRQRAK